MVKEDITGLNNIPTEKGWYGIYCYINGGGDYIDHWASASYFNGDEYKWKKALDDLFFGYTRTKQVFQSKEEALAYVESFIA